MAGQIVVDHQHIPPLLHKIFGNGGGGIGGNVLLPWRVIPFGDHHRGVIHRPPLPQLRYHRSDTGGPLADGAIDTQHPFVVLVNDGVDG